MPDVSDASPDRPSLLSSAGTPDPAASLDETAPDVPSGPRIVAMLPVRNEAERHLRACLDGLARVAARIVVLDDASTDATPEVCQAYPTVAYHRLDAPLFAQDEARLRRLLWSHAVAESPEWLLALDADECFEEGAERLIPLLCDQQDYDVVAFRLFDLWGSPDRVRVDGGWNPWNRFAPLLARFDPKLDAAWPPLKIHCGRWPAAYRDRITFYSHLRVRHHGWMDAERHADKYAFYRERDLAVSGAVQPHTESILDPHPRLEPWLDAGVPSYLSPGA